jgi:hypothetical protein
MLVAAKFVPQLFDLFRGARLGHSYEL